MADEEHPRDDSPNGPARPKLSIARSIMGQANAVRVAPTLGSSWTRRPTFHGGRNVTPNSSQALRALARDSANSGARGAEYARLGFVDSKTGSRFVFAA